MTSPSNQAPQVVEVDEHDFPLYCPTPAMQRWSSHPRVFLNMKHDSHQAVCPYCGTTYQLKPGTVLKGH